MIVEKDIPYCEAAGYAQALNTLDIYFLAQRSRVHKKPIVLFVHGGGWFDGDKSFGDDAALPRWFVERGYVFVSVNFRLAQHSDSPHATIYDLAKDIAKAIKWLTVNGGRYGGKSKGFVLLGYSSGAHLATLLSTDETFLGQFHLSPSLIEGVIALDVPHLDIPRAMELMETEETGVPLQTQRLAKLNKLFGSTRDARERFSPATYLHPGLCHTSFLLVTTGFLSGHRQSLSRSVTELFARQLQTLGIKAEHHHFENVDHIEIIPRFTELIAVHVLPFLESLEPRTQKGECTPVVGVVPASCVPSPPDQIKPAQRTLPKHLVRTPRRIMPSRNS